MDIYINARALLINPEGQILLMKVRPDVYDPSGKIESPYWMTPGGGVEVDETPAQAVARELFEECGITNLNIGPKVWHWDHILEIRSKLIQLQDHYFVVQAEDSRISIDGMYLYESEDFLEYRWWKAKEIKSSDEIFSPPDLGQLLEELLTNDLGVQQIINIH